MDADSNPLHPTYPKRAKQLVKQGRAEWIGDHAIRLTARSSREAEAMRTMTQEIRPSIDWALEFRRLVDEIIRNNEVSLAAIEAIEAIGHCRDDSVPNASDAPAQAIAQIVAANNQLKMQALGMLQTVIEMQLQERGPSAD